MRYVEQTAMWDAQEQLTDNFKMGEFSSPDGYIIWNTQTEKFLRMLQQFRKWLNKPINVSSMYRTPEHNKKVNGASNSPHMQGIAADIPWGKTIPEYLTATSRRKKEIEDNITTQWSILCAKEGIHGGGVEICPAHFHLDIMPRTNGFKKWYGASN